ncbi:uncharacterized protein LOC135710257 [Ochlerotatus camptorhynchus]|uniref:uncharacterized protein LOC135710257 n=1 Tax=Ochlerotatus camptorhynchus TaxID=644619 RepID=UPI0031CE94D2
METIPSDPVQSTEESRCEELYAATTTRDSSGRYVVRLPRVEDPEIMLGESRSIADRRFLSLERRLERDPATKDSYHRFMEEYLQLGHMKKVEEPVDDHIQHCYIPHHVVFKESSTTTNVRQDLYSIYLRFRTRVVAIVADVEKMYRQVLHHLIDLVFFRIRYRRSPTDPIATYELQTVTYGTASAPYLATKTFQQIAKDHEHLYPAAVNSVVEDFYVDDLLSGASDVEAAIILRREITAMLSYAGFMLKKWASNAHEVLEDVPPEDLAIQPIHDLQDEQTISTLGLLWEPTADMLRFKVELPLPAAILIKRKVMSYIAQIFDPLGLLGPTTTKAKLFMQHLWTLMRNGVSCEWDSPLPEKLQADWKQFHSTLHILADIRIPPLVLASGVNNIQLHFFADASSIAYVPCFSGWSPNRWKTFVANRVSKIQTTTDINHWRHIAGLENPADDISRGLNPTDILHRYRWWHGPPWLSQTRDLWPKTIIDQEYSPAASEEGRKIPIVAMTTAQATLCEDLFARYSSYSKLRRVLAFCERYLQCLKDRSILRKSDPSFADLLSDLANGERVIKSSSLKWLNPFVDQNDIIRVGGRIRNAALSDAIKHPIVLSAKHPLSALLASSYHQKLLHAGPQLLLATLRQKFWILGGRNLIKSVFHQCHTCFRSKPTLVQQSTADLPVSRVSPTRPFSVCGIDYCGPFYIKSAVRKRGPTKIYVAIFVCFSTKAVHIELVSDLSTPAFLAALRV